MSVDLSIRLPACLNPNFGQTVPCRIKINSNKGRSLENGNVGRDDTFFPVVKYNYLCADFCSRQFMESWSLLLSWNLRPTFYLIDFYRIYFEIWFNRSDEQKFWIVFQYNFYILWENGNLFWLEIKHWPLNNELIFQKRCFNDKRVFILCFSIPCRLSTVLQHRHVFYIYIYIYIVDFPTCLALTPCLKHFFKISEC